MDWRNVARNGVPMLVVGVMLAVFVAFGTRLPVTGQTVWRVVAVPLAALAFASGLCPRRARLRLVAGIGAVAFIIGYGYQAWMAGGVGSYSLWLQIAFAVSIAWSWGRHG
jgi:hypothetical protein